MISVTSALSLMAVMKSDKSVTFPLIIRQENAFSFMKQVTVLMEGAASSSIVSGNIRYFTIVNHSFRKERQLDCKGETIPYSEAMENPEIYITHDPDCVCMQKKTR